MKRRRLTIENQSKFVEDILACYRDDLYDRSEWSEARLQRYAKYRGWLEPKNYPWPDASSQHVPLLMSNSQRTQDTLHNAVLTTRPVMSAIAINGADREKGPAIDELQDYQLFVEQPGEEKIGELIDSYVNDGKFVAFIPWVKERREVLRTLPLPVPQDGQTFESMHIAFLRLHFPGSFAEQTSPDTYHIRWKDEYQQSQSAKAEFSRDDEGRPFAQLTTDEVIFDGPCLIPKALEDIVVPSRAANLQAPGPSNPNGADHVIMVDYPSWDEIVRLQQKDYYDLLTDKQIEVLEERADGESGDTGSQTMDDTEQHKIQRDLLAGQTYGNAKTTSKTFTRLTYFGRWDLDDDGLEEEIVARVLLEKKYLCRVRHLQEEFPTPTPRRPFAEATLIPVPGQFYGISLLELLEHLHNLTKVLLDQMIDKHTLSNSPWGVYRSASGVRPEVIRMAPGELYPVSNPQQDIAFPAIPQQDQSIALNLIALVQQWADRTSMQGALQFGGVPQGKASALRTSTNMNSVLQQGDARPERILRRFFRGLAEIYTQMHELNQAFLPAKKQYRVTGVQAQGTDPYRTVESAQAISGRFQFDFKANALNTNKALTSQVLSELAPMLINGMMMQSGLVTIENVYNLIRDIIQSKGQDENKYINAPPQSKIPKITAEDALGQIISGTLPHGRPSEGARTHLEILRAFLRDPRIIEVSTEPAFRAIYTSYVQQVQRLAMQEQEQAAQAQQFAQTVGGGGGGQTGPPGQVDPNATQPGMQGQNQVSDESLPSAGGGAMGAQG
jgi:hypothetical protein